MVIGLAIFVWWGVEFQVFPLTLVVVLVPECDKKSRQLTIANRCALILTWLISQSKGYIHDFLLVIKWDLILRGTPKFGGAPLAQSHAHLFFCMWFYHKPWEIPVHAELEVTSYSRCRNIKENPQILGSSPSSGTHLLFLLDVILWWALKNPAVCQFWSR